MDDATPEPRRCTVCGDPIRSDNRSGICHARGKPACAQARNDRFREQGKVRSEPASPRPDGRNCDVCGCPIRRDNATGVCGDPWKPACRAERKRRKEAGLVAERQPAVTAGDVFGKWTALEASERENKRILCRCECGTERRVQVRRLILGQSPDCGCAWQLEAAARRFTDPYIRAGAVFGRLTVLEDVRRQQHDTARCLCECGTEVMIATPQALKTGHTKSCGCLRRERNTTHGFSAHPLFKTWKGMIQRCTNPASAQYANYGGRGIGICDRWMDIGAFIEDIEREIGPRPEGRYPSGMPLYTLDRIEVDEGYRPGNVQWADQSTQVRNQRKIGTLTRERDAAIARAGELEALLRSLAPEQGCEETPESLISGDIVG